MPHTARGVMVRKEKATVLFYKIWNGRIKYGKGPTEDMPAFEGKLSKDQVWTLVEYLKVLRAPPR